MSAAAHQHGRPVTDGSDARVRVRAADHLRLVPDPGSESPGFAYTRAIPHEDRESKGGARPKVRNFASPHVDEAKQAVAKIWFVTERPDSLADVARRIADLPAGFGPAVLHIAAGLVRLPVQTLAYLMCFAVSTNTRVAVSFCLTVAAVAAAGLAEIASH
jgi:hypothetical protein